MEISSEFIQPSITRNDVNAIDEKIHVNNWLPVTNVPTTAPRLTFSPDLFAWPLRPSAKG